jgi:hypothetical protein
MVAARGEALNWPPPSRACGQFGAEYDESVVELASPLEVLDGPAIGLSIRSHERLWSSAPGGVPLAVVAQIHRVWPPPRSAGGELQANRRP